MRILILTETYLPEIGGSELQAQLLSGALVERGHNVVILTRRSRRDLAKAEVIDGVQVLRIGPAGPGRWRKWGLAVTAVVPLVRLRNAIDVVLVSGFRILGIPSLLTVNRYACVLKADSTGEMSGEFFRAGLRKLRLTPTSFPVRLAVRSRNALLRRAGAFVAISREIQDELIRSGVAATRVHVVPNGVDTNRFQPASDAERCAIRGKLGLPPGPIAIYTGRLVSYKGLPQLVRVWRNLKCAGVEGSLVLVGTAGGDMHACEHELRAFVTEHRLEESVVFTGSVANVHEYLRAANVFVFPTQNEAFGVSLIEAMACGLPAVATRVGGIPEFFVDGRHGIMIDPHREDELERALRSLLSGNGGAYGAAARRDVVDRFSATAVMNGYLSIFEATCSGTAARSS